MKVLFIGNSHTYVNNLPHIVSEFAKEDNINMDVTMIAHPGWFLKQHLKEPEVKFNILYGNYDYIVLQEHAHPFGPVEDFYDGVRGINEFIKQTNSKVVIYTTWARKVHPEDQEYMMKCHRKIGGEINAIVAPVDEEWIKEDRDKLYGPDGEHASLIGSTLAAKVIYSTIKKDFLK